MSKQDKLQSSFHARIHPKQKWILAIVSYNKLGATKLYQHLQSGTLDDFVRRGEMMYYDTPADDQDDIAYYLVETRDNKFYLYVELDPNEPLAQKTPLCTVPTSLTLEEVSKIYSGYRLVEKDNIPIKLDNIYKISFLGRIGLIFRQNYFKSIFFYLIAVGVIFYLLLILFR